MTLSVVLVSACGGNNDSASEATGDVETASGAEAVSESGGASVGPINITLSSYLGDSYEGAGVQAGDWLVMANCGLAENPVAGVNWRNGEMWFQSFDSGSEECSGGVVVDGKVLYFWTFDDPSTLAEDVKTEILRIDPSNGTL